MASRHIDEIIINTDCDEVKESLAIYQKIRIVDRPEFLRGNHIVANELIHHDIQITTSEHFLQTHCTNPLLSVETVDLAIRQYFEQLDAYDSLFSVYPIFGRLYAHDLSELNHHRNNLERTQDLLPVYMENSAFFIFSKASFQAAGNCRIGLHPNIFKMKQTESVDIDYEEDFLLAELIYQNRSRFL